MFDFGRAIVSNAHTNVEREWLVTNGIGGYASGTIAGLITRRYHGLLVAALKPPLGRTLLLSKLDETLTYDGRTVDVFTNQWQTKDAALAPKGYYHLERFHLEGSIPVWTYAVGDAQLQKRIWMQHGENITYIHYTLARATQALTLNVKALINYTDFHVNTRADGWALNIEDVPNGIRVVAHDTAMPYYLLSTGAQVQQEHAWYRSFFLRWENQRGLDDLADQLHGSTFTATLQPGDSVTIVATLDSEINLDGASAYREERARGHDLITISGKADAPQWIQQLVLAADQFIVRRPHGGNPNGRSVIAGYHWFGDWGRDTMISLPGLTLTTNRADEAASILRTYGEYVNNGMLPNRFPDTGDDPEYNTVDATLWYFEAIRATYQQTQDESLLHDLYPKLQEIIEWHEHGTRYHIKADPDDALLYSGEEGVQLTWMDAKIGDWVVTPRTGKAVEINALWYNALRIMADFAIILNQNPNDYTQTADKVQASFARFWNAAAGYLYDVLDTPDGTHDALLRPNQIFAVSLTHSPLPAQQQQAVVDVCARELYTSMGLHSLAPGQKGYSGNYGGTPYDRDSAYHQGTIWTWLIGPFIAAHLRVYQDVDAAWRYLEPFMHNTTSYGIGTLPEAAQGNRPYAPRAAIAQAWSVAEVLRAYDLIRAGQIA
jgi:predicted glycogen debranching enzyme